MPGAGDELRVEEEVADGEVGEDGFEELGDLEEVGERYDRVGVRHGYGYKSNVLFFGAG